MRWNRDCLSAPARWFALLVAAAALLGCQERAAQQKKAATRPPTVVTVAEARSGSIESVERTLGTLESVIDPKVAAEVAGRVVRIHARTGTRLKRGDLLAELDRTDNEIALRAEEAEIARLESLLAQQERVVQRQRQLVERNFVSRNALDDAAAQRDALSAAISAARARADAARRALTKTRVLAPIDGAVEVQIAAVGDYVKVGDPLFQLVSAKKLRAHLPFPESIGAQLRAGLPVRLTSPQAPGREFSGLVTDIRPSIIEGSRALDVLVDIENDGALRGGGTVDATIVLGRSDGAVLVPEQSIVLRPAGEVVYLVANGKAQQRQVKIGVRRGGLVEIRDGLKAGETVAVDGAGFLSHGAEVQVRAGDPAPPAPAAKAAGT